jgi:hypothetical protein
MEKRFTIIHFSGHGLPSGIVMESPAQESGEIVGVEQLKKILESRKPDLTAAVFLSCFSSDIANLLIEEVPYIIAVCGEASDEHSVKFTQSFYTSLFLGQSLRHAFNMAKTAVEDNLNITMFRRSERDGVVRALVSHTRQWDRELLIDVSRILPDVDRLGTTINEVTSRIANKIRYHHNAFRYPRQNATFPIGPFFGKFSWENADDIVYCDRLYKLRNDVDEVLAETWVHLLIKYHDAYVTDYRGPLAVAQVFNEPAVKKGLNGLEEMFKRFVRDEKTSDLFRRAAPEAFRNVRIVGGGALQSAESKFYGGEVGGAASDLEVVLSSVHEFVDAIGDLLLE